MPDMINQPPHYLACRPQVEPIDLTEHVGFNLGNAIKYISRAGKKDGSSYEQDIGKAMFYLKREIERCRMGGLTKVASANPAAFCYWYWLVQQHPFLVPLLELRVDPITQAGEEQHRGYRIHWSARSVERAIQALTAKLQEGKDE